MLSSNNTKMRIHEALVIVISLAIIFELFYSPNAGYMKTIGAFPAINIGFTFLPSELLTFLFVYIGMIYILEKMRRSDRVIIAPKPYSTISKLVILFVLINCFTGFIVFRNGGALQEVRKMLIPVLFYIIYINSDIPPNWDKKIYNLIAISLIVLTAIYFLDFFKIDVLSALRSKNIGGSHQLLHFLMLSLLVFNVAAARLLFSKFSYKWLLILSFTLCNLILNISYKACIFALLVSCAVLFYFKVKTSRHGALKVITISCVTIGIFAAMFIYAPTRFKDRMAQYIAARYLKVDDVTSVDQFTHEDMISAASQKDLSTYRFGMWKYFLKESLSGYGLAPKGFGAKARGITYGLAGVGNVFSGEMSGTHNLLLYYAYHCGLITAVLVLLLIVRYVRLNAKVLLRLKPGTYEEFKREELIALYSFTISVIAVNMVGLSISNLSLAWIFWFCVAVIIKRWNLMSESVKLDEDIKPV